MFNLIFVHSRDTLRMLDKWFLNSLIKRIILCFVASLLNLCINAFANREIFSEQIILFPSSAHSHAHGHTQACIQALSYSPPGDSK